MGSLNKGAMREGWSRHILCNLTAVCNTRRVQETGVQQLCERFWVTLHACGTEAVLKLWLGHEAFNKEYHFHGEELSSLQRKGLMPRATTGNNPCMSHACARTLHTHRSTQSCVQ
jgi:hypothetical protein